MTKHIVTALGVIATLAALGMAYDHLATDTEVVAGFKSFKRVTDLQYLQQQIDYLELRRDLACKNEPAGHECLRYQAQLDRAKEALRKFLRRE